MRLEVPRSREGRWCGWARRAWLSACLGALLCVGAVLCVGAATAQTLARPGWAGSGLTVERWWRDAVLYEVTPAAASAGEPELLERVTARLDDLRALGVDAVLLRGVSAVAAAGAPPISARYGSLEQFDRLLTEASQRHIRVIVELTARDAPSSLEGEARFWLSRGVTGLYLASAEGVDERQAVRSLRGLLRGFVGERVLVGDAAAFGGAAGAATLPQGEGGEGDGRRGRRAGRRDSVVSGGGGVTPDLVLMPLGGLGGAAADLGALRTSLEVIGRGRGAGSAVATIAGEAPPASAEQARAAVTVLLSVRGGVMLDTRELGLDALSTPPPAPVKTTAAAASGPDAGSLVAWTTRMVGLHRGNATLRRGVQTVLDRDVDGVLVVVWRGAGVGSPVLVEVVNLTGKPVEFALTDDFARLRLRGSFLRTVLRSDEGMGAMPLRAVHVAGYGVYLGELSR